MKLWELSASEIVTDIKNKKILYFKKVIYPTDEERKKHSQYLKSSLKKNFFN